MATAVGTAATWDGWLKLGAVVTAVGVLAGFWFTNHSLQATNRQIQAADRQYELSRQSDISNRLATAIGLLDKPGVDSRIGAIYLLEHIAQDSPKDRATAYETIGAFIRTQIPRTKDCESAAGEPGQDVKTALKVVGRRDSPTDEKVDLTSICLVGATLEHVDLREVDLTNASIARTKITYSNLSGDILKGASLADMELTGNNLTGACMASAHLSKVKFFFDDFTKARILKARLDDVEIYSAKISSSNNSGILYVAGSDLRSVDLRGSGLSQPSVKFEGISYDGATSWPDGLVPPVNLAEKDRPFFGVSDCTYVP